MVDQLIAEMPTLMTLDDTTKYADMLVKVHAETEHIPCHKAILCQYSAVIARAMESTFKEGQTGEFTITDPGATVENVRQFLLAMYNPWDSKMDKFVHDIYRLAHVYQTRKVLDMCAVAFGRLMTLENFWQSATVYNGHTTSALTEVCREFMAKQTATTVSTLLNSTNVEYIAAQKYPAVVMPIAVDALARQGPVAPAISISCYDGEHGQPKEFYALCKYCVDYGYPSCHFNKKVHKL